MKKFRKIFLIVLFSTFLIIQIQAQTPQKTKYMVWEIELSPMQLTKAIGAIKAQNEFLKSQNYPYASITQYSGDGYLWYSVPFTKYAEIDEMETASKNLWKDNPEKSKEIQEKFKDTYNKASRMIIESQPELSIFPEVQTDNPSGKRFRIFEKFYVKKDKGEAFEKQIKRYVELRKKHNIKAPFYTYYPAFNSDFSIVYFIDELGENAAEHYTENEAAWQKFGEEGQQLWEDVSQTIEKVETHLGTIDYDLLYVPAN